MPSAKSNKKTFVLTLHANDNSMDVWQKITHKNDCIFILSVCKMELATYPPQQTGISLQATQK